MITWPPVDPPNHSPDRHDEATQISITAGVVAASVHDSMTNPIRYSGLRYARCGRPSASSLMMAPFT